MTSHGGNTEGLIEEFRDWVRQKTAEPGPPTSTAVDDLLRAFLVAKGVEDIESYIGGLQELRQGRLYQSIVDEFAELGANVKTGQDDRRVDALERYRSIPLHAMFLYTSEDRSISNYILENWGALDSLSGELCDVHPTMDQFKSAEDAYDFIEKLDVLQSAGFREYSKLPGLFFWDLKANSEYVPFGSNDSTDEIRTVVRTVFEEVKKEPSLESVKKARDRLALNSPEDAPRMRHDSPIWKDLAPFVTVFLVILASIAIASMWVSPLLLGIVLIGTILVLLIIGVFVFRHRDIISENAFVNIISRVTQQLPLLRKTKEQGTVHDESKDRKGS